jgi:cytochrome P450
VFICPSVTHRLPSLWAKPSEFIIDRWLTDNEKKILKDDEGDAIKKDEGAKSPFTYMPFLVGPHGCIGRRFALLEACTALAVMLKSYSFKPVPGREVRATLRVTQRPTPSLQLIVSPRAVYATRAS